MLQLCTCPCQLDSCHWRHLPCRIHTQGRLCSHGRTRRHPGTLAAARVLTVGPGPSCLPWHPILGVCLQLAPATTQASVADPRSCGCTHHWFHAPQPVLLLGPRGAAKDPNSHCSLWGLPAAFIKDHSVVDAIDVGNLNQRDHHRDPAPLLDPLPSHNLVTWTRTHDLGSQCAVLSPNPSRCESLHLPESIHNVCKRR